MEVFHRVSGNLHNLTFLSAGYNQLTGSIPADLGNLTFLYSLYLDGNQLTGNIPPQLGNLSNLYVLQLGDNQLTGEIPSELGNLTGLWGLYLYNNRLNGTIPSSLGNLSSSQLQWLRLDGNQLVGEIPSSLGNLSSLQGLYLNNGQLTGQIPQSFGNLTNLRWLQLQNNLLSGEIPSLIGLTSLEWVDFSTNQLTGPVPAWLNSLPNLAYLNLFSNQLTGTIPDLSGLNNLWLWSLGSNQLTGEIPAWLNNLPGLTYLYLSNNPFTGSAPNLANLINLGVLGLGDNLTGPVPDLSNLSHLYWLDLSNNQFTGEIPSWISALNEVQFLDLSYNQLTGAIPPELGNLVTLQYLYLSNNHLSGSIPSELGGLSGSSIGGMSVNIRVVNAQRTIEGQPPEVPAIPLLPASIGIPQESSPETGRRNATASELSALISDALSTMSREQENEPASAQALTGLISLAIDNNQLSGEIPSELGNLTPLSFLDLSRNALRGEVPELIINLTNLAWLDIGFNALEATNSSTMTFLESEDPDWAQTQTIPPTDVSAVNVSSDSVELSWSPILYTWNDGYYEVRLASEFGGPYDQITCTTTDKLEAGCLVDGLAADTTYYFVVRTFSHANDNNPQNDLWSNDSAQIEVTTEPISTSLLCTVELLGRPAAPDESWVVSLHVVITPQSSTTPLLDQQVTTDQTGQFELDGLMPGDYLLWAKGEHTLAVVQPLTIVVGVNQVIIGPLYEGDIDDNNMVNLTDFSLLVTTFGKQASDNGYDGRADFNGDGVVNLLDFSLLVTNFGLAGET